MRIRGLLAIVACILISSCATVAGSKGPPSHLKGKDVYYDTQTVIGECPDPQESAALIALGSAVVAQGVSKIADAIKAAGSLDTQTLNARRNVEIRTKKGIGPCVVVVRGWFYRDPPGNDADFQEVPGYAFPVSKAEVSQTFWKIGLHLAATPDFYFRGNVRRSTDQSAYTIMPRLAVLNRPASKNLLRPSGQRNILVAFSLSEGGGSADLSKGGGSTIALGAMKPGELIQFTKIECLAYVRAATAVDPKTSGTNTCPSTDDFDSLTHSQYESNWFTVKQFEKQTPMLLQALVTETQSPSKFLQFVGDVLGSSKEAITKDLQQASIPSVGDQADLADLSADDAKKTAFDTALNKAIIDLKACKSTPDDQTKRVSARIALRALVGAGLARGNQRVNSLSPDAITTNEKTATACDAQLNLVLAL